MVTLLEIIDLACMMAFNAEENNHFNFEGYIFFFYHIQALNKTSV